MKRLFVLTLLGLFTCGVVFAQPKNNDKSLWKSAKKKAKELTAEGWKIDDSRTLEEVMFLHYQKLRNEENQELVANVIGNTSVEVLNQGQQFAANIAAISYAKQAGMNLKGRGVVGTGAGTKGTPSMDRFFEGYEFRVQKEIKGELKRSVSLYREKRKEGIDCKIFYIINEAAASKARIRAMEQARKEAEFAIEDAERISEFVREGFKVESEE